MVATPRQLEEELDALSGKIATIRHLLREGGDNASKVDAYLDKKLHEYSSRYSKLKADYTAFWGRKAA